MKIKKSLTAYLNLSMTLGVSITMRLPYTTKAYKTALICSNKKDTSDFHGTVSFGQIKMSQQNLNQNVYQTSDTQKLVII